MDSWPSSSKKRFILFLLIPWSQCLYYERFGMCSVELDEKVKVDARNPTSGQIAHEVLSQGKRHFAANGLTKTYEPSQIW